MTPEEHSRFADLEVENAALRAQVAALLTEVQELKGRLAKDSHNSSKPPSSDGLARPNRPPKKTRSLRQPSGKKPGGQPGHRGTTLALVDAPDQVVVHRPPSVCATCRTPLEGAAVERVERRQVQDLPPVRLVVTEHRAERVRCPHCHTLSPATFPASVAAPAQYGPGVRALAVYLSQYQLLPVARVQEVLATVVGCALAAGTVISLIQRAATALERSEAATKTALQAVPVLHNDETPVRVHGQWHYVHVSSTERLTHYGLHRQRGATAIDAIGILPVFRGTSIHDGWKPYWHYHGCRHALCNIHHLRELTWVAEHLQQAWAQDLKDLLLQMRDAVAAAREAGASQLTDDQRDTLLARYTDLLCQGIAANPLSAGPPPDPADPAAPPKRRRGRRKQSVVRNLLDRLFQHQHEVLAFLDDFAVPFDNNRAERDLRMNKVQQKVSGCFRSLAGAVAFCRIRGVLSTLRKQGTAVLSALRTLFEGHALLLPDTT